MSVQEVNDKNFEEQVVKSKLPVLVDFWAEWCIPCKEISPIVDEIESELSAKLKVAKVNVDEAQELATKFGVMSIPTLLVFKDGQVVEQIVGAIPKEQILSKVNPHLS